MKPIRPDNGEILRLIEEMSLEADYTDEESSQTLRDAGIDPDRFAMKVRRNLNAARRSQRRKLWGLPWDFWALGKGGALTVVTVCAVVIAVSAVSFVRVSFPASVEAQRQLARAQLISPLLPALSSDDPQRREVALTVAQQVDPVFAAETAKQLERLAVYQAQTRFLDDRITPYSRRITAGLQKLQFSRNPDDRKEAIWNDLLPTLKEAQKNRDDFFAVAIEYRKVLPLLRVSNPDVFLDSYWGELWIFNILLDSKISPVVEAARELAPNPTVVEQVFRQNAAALPDEKRKAFEEALSVYGNRLKGAQ